MDCTHPGCPTRLHFCSARAACLPPETPALISSLSPTSAPTQVPPGSTWGAFSRERDGIQQACWSEPVVQDSGLPFIPPPPPPHRVPMDTKAPVVRT